MNRSLLIRLVILLAIVVFLVLIFRFTPLGDLLTPEKIAAAQETLVGWVDAYFLPTALGFVAVYIVVVALSVPGASLLTISGGFLFGPWFATLFVNIGATLGAFLVFLAARFILGKTVQEKYAESLAKFNREIEENGQSYLLTLRFIPIFPFWLINLMAGFTTVKARTFLWTTAVGIIPGSFVYAYIGHAGQAVFERGIFTPEILIALILLAIISLIPVAIKKLRRAK